MADVGFIVGVASWFFEGWDSLVRILLVGPAIYVALVTTLRISGKRTLSKLNAFDLVVTVALGSVLGAVLVNGSISVAEGVVAIAVLVLSQLVVTFLSVRWPRFERFVKAEPSVVLENGIPRTDEMREVRVTRQELRAAMREAGVTAEEHVQAITLETDGSLTVVERSSEHGEPGSPIT